MMTDEEAQALIDQMADHGTVMLMRENSAARDAHLADSLIIVARLLNEIRLLLKGKPA